MVACHCLFVVCHLLCLSLFCVLVSFHCSILLLPAALLVLYLNVVVLVANYAGSASAFSALSLTWPREVRGREQVWNAWCVLCIILPSFSFLRLHLAVTLFSGDFLRRFFFFFLVPGQRACCSWSLEIDRIDLWMY